MAKSAQLTGFNAEIYHLMKDFDQLLYFEWDFLQDFILFTEPVEDSPYDLLQEMELASSQMCLTGRVHPDDLGRLGAVMNTVFQIEDGQCGYKPYSVKIRLRERKNSEDYIWIELRLLVYFEDGQAIRAFGNLKNINEQQVLQMELQHTADHDALTGFLNKSACQRRVEDYLLQMMMTSYCSAALMIVDADGFKAINDNFGHLFGDAVLNDMALAIKNNFRQGDILGRIGGDEFLVLVKDAPSRDMVVERAKALLKILDRNYKNNDESLPFSVSIGISFYPEHGKTYAELFKHADRALYEAKAKGKNCHFIYHGSLIGTQVSVVSERDPQNEAEIQQRLFKDNMLEYIFKLLYETNNPEATISLSLGMFGKQFNLDRVAVYRYNSHTCKYMYAFEWLGPNGLSVQEFEKENPDAVEMRSQLILSNYKPTSYGVMSIVEDTTKAGEKYQKACELTRLRSFAHCMITHGTEDLGCIAFESSQAPRPFTKEELTDLSVFSVLLGNILLSRDSDHQTKQMLQHLRDVLDHMQEFIYVVDKETLEPVFFNQTIRQALASATVNQPCYERFHNLKKPCVGCPLPRLSAKGNEYIDVILDNWGAPTNTRVYNIRWEEEDVRHMALIIQEPF